MESGIYSIINKINGKCYVGSAIDLKKRNNAHFQKLNSRKHHSRYLQNAWNKYGSENFEFIILEYVEKEKLTEKEQFYLDLFESYKSENGYNVCLIANSSLGVKRTLETRQKISKVLVGTARNLGHRHSEETKKKLSLFHKGKKRTEEDCRKISLGQIGRKLSEETKCKISDSHKGKKLSDNHKLKLSIGHKGKKLSEKHKLNLSKAQRGMSFLMKQEKKYQKHIRVKNFQMNLV